MNCPYCDVELSIRALHAHLVDEHGDQVGSEEQGERSLYVVACPRCGERYRHPMRKAVRDAEFVAEHERQIRLVAFDMLINHLLAEHELEQPAP